MNKKTILAIIFFACFIVKINNAEALCARCVEANENNKNNPNPYFYYEEYLDAQNAGV